MDPRRATRRRLGVILGLVGLALVFGPAAAMLAAPPGSSAVLLGLMVVGVVVLVAGFLTVPRKL